MAFDGVDIAADGTVPFRSGERISFSYLVSNKYTGDSVCMRGVVRGCFVMRVYVWMCVCVCVNEGVIGVCGIEQGRQFLVFQCT